MPSAGLPLLLAAASAAAARGAATAQLIFTQSEATATYTSVGTTTLGGGARPYFAVATSLNPPFAAYCYDGAGAQTWAFTNGTGSTYLLDTARHAEGQDAGPVDVAVAVCGTPAQGCVLYGRTSATDTTRWALPLPHCATNVEGGTYVNLEASDSGSSAAFLCRYTDPASGAASARVYLVAMQSGSVAWTHDLGAGVKAGQGQVQVTPSGSFVLFVNEGGVPTPNTASAYVLDGASGALRDTITIPFFITAAVSDSGDYVAVGDDPAVHVWLWNATAGRYAPAFSVAPPGAGAWTPWDMQISTGSDASEALMVGYISGDVRTVQVANWRLATGAQQGAWVSSTNPKLQENPTIRTDGDYVSQAGSALLLAARFSATPLLPHLHFSPTQRNATRALFRLPCRCGAMTATCQRWCSSRPPRTCRSLPTSRRAP